MGGFFATAIKKIFGAKEQRILMVGLDAAGKTTILYKLKLGEVITTIPTIGFNVETVQYKNISFTVWDMGGRGNFRKSLWKHYYANTHGIIFVVDSNDSERIGNLNPTEADKNNKFNYFSDSNAAEELYKFLQDEQLKDAVLLVMANKQDLPNAMSIETIKNNLGLENKYTNKEWHIQPTCATTGDGLYEGLDWLSRTLNKKKKK
eukprot:408173_1